MASSRELIKKMGYNSLDKFDLTEDECLRRYCNEIIDEGKERSLIDSLGIISPLKDSKYGHLPEKYQADTDNLFSSTSNPILIEYNGDGIPRRMMWENSYLNEYNNWTMSTGSLATQATYRQVHERNTEEYDGYHCERCGKPLNFFERREGRVCNKCEVEMGWKQDTKAIVFDIKFLVNNLMDNDIESLSYEGRIKELADFKNLRGYLVES